MSNMKKRSVLPLKTLMIVIAFAFALTGCGWDSGPNDAANTSGHADQSGNAGKTDTNGGANGNAAEPAAANDGGSKKPIELLNVSYDPTRELYEAYDKLFSDIGRKRKAKKLRSSNPTAAPARRPARLSTAWKRMS